MDLKDITMEMFSERPTTTTKFSRELIDILANPENTIAFRDYVVKVDRIRLSR